MFALHLNPMTSNTETSVCVAIADTQEQLEEFLKQERVEPYSEEGPSSFFEGNTTYHKVFKKDGPLEMFNPPESSFCEPSGIIEIPSREEVIDFHNRAMEAELVLWDNFFGHVQRL